MKKFPQDKRIEFWKFAYALDSFVKARELCKSFLSLESNDVNISMALCTSVITFYGRPFKQRPKVKLTDNIIPDEFREIHDNLITLRDKTVAHKDLDAPIADFGSINQLIIRYENKRLAVHTVLPLLSETTAKDIIKLTTELIEKMEYHMSKYSKEYFHKSSIPNGRYSLSLDEDDSCWLTK